MAIVAKSAGNETFVNAPQGSHQGVCCDVIDVGLVAQVDQKTGVTKQVHKIDIVWQIPIINEETGKRFTVRRRYTLSLNEKANLRKELEAWRGKPFPKEIVETGFDVENLLGVNALLNVQHEASREGRVYANVKAIMALPQGMTPIAPVEYVRKCDRDPQAAAPAQTGYTFQAPTPAPAPAPTQTAF